MLSRSTTSAPRVRLDAPSERHEQLGPAEGEVADDRAPQAGPLAPVSGPERAAEAPEVAAVPDQHRNRDEVPEHREDEQTKSHDRSPEASCAELTPGTCVRRQPRPFRRPACGGTCGVAVVGVSSPAPPLYPAAPCGGTSRPTVRHAVPMLVRKSMDWNFADLFEAVADTVPDNTAIICGDRRLHVRRARRALDAAREPPDRRGRRGRRPRRHLRVQRPGVGRGDVRDLEGAGRPDQRQLPLRRGRALVPLRQRRSHRARARTRVHPADRRGARGRAEAQGVRLDRGRHRRGPRDDRRGRVRGRARGRVARRAFPARAAPTTSTCSTPAAPPACPRA